MYSDFVRGFLVGVRKAGVLDIRQLFVHQPYCDEMAKEGGVRSGSENAVTASTSDDAGQYFPFLLATLRN